MKRKGTNMEDNRIIECIERANYILGNLMAVTEKDEVLIVIDDQTDRRMANAMAGQEPGRGVWYLSDACSRQGSGHHFPQVP